MSDRYKKLRENEDIVLKRTRKFLRENKSLVLEKDQEEKTKPEDNTGLGKFIQDSWGLMDSTESTAVLETLPLLFMLKPDISNLSDISNLINKEGGRDWHEKAKKWFPKFQKSLTNEIEKIIKKMEKGSKTLSNKSKSSFEESVNKKVIDFFKQKIESKGSQTLRDILGEDPTDFIHGSIDEFHRVFGTGQNREQGVKKFTADIILVYGTNWKSILSLKGDDTKFEVDGISAVLKNGTRIVPVSLKADGRIGKVGGIPQILDRVRKELETKYSTGGSKEKTKFGRSEYEPIDTITGESSRRNWSEQFLDEGLFDDPFGTLKDFWSDVKAYGKKKLDQMKNAFLFVKNWFKDILQSLTNVFDDFTKESKKEEDIQKKVGDMIEDMLNGLETVEESKLDQMTAPVTIDTCFREKLKNMGKELGYQGVESDFDNIQELMDSLARKANTYSKKTDLFRVSYPDKDKPFIPDGQHFKSLQDLATLYNKIMTAKSVSETSSSSTKSCSKLDVKVSESQLTRDSLKTFLWQYANMRSIRLINGFIDDIIKVILREETDNKKVRDFLIQLCVDINAESVFGNANGFPLVKYDTGVIKRYGQRGNYIEDKVVKIAKSFKKENPPPVIGLKINRTSAKSLTNGEQFAYYQIAMFILVDIDVEETSVNEIPDNAFSYGVLTFKNNSGTEFTFVMEIDREDTGDKVLNALQTQK